MSRADKISPLQKVPEYYADFLTNFDLNPVTGQLARLTNADAVIQSIQNLVLTDPHERFYQPHIGSRVQESLFGLGDDPITLDNIRTSISDCIKTNEPRAQVTNIDIQSVDNGYNVNVTFTIINIQQTFTATIFIDRVR